MNYWKDDPVRHESHRRGAVRRMGSSLRLLLVVLGWLALVLGGVLALLAIRENDSVRHNLLRLSTVHVAGGLSLIVLHLLAFVVPQVIAERLSRSARLRRREERSSRRLPARPPPAVPRPASGREGVALVLVLVMLALVATLVVESQVTARALLRRNEAVAGMSSLRRAAADAARTALQRLADDEDLAVDYTNETCFAAEDTATPDGISLHVTVCDENRFFDLNNLSARNVPPTRTPQDILGDLFTLCGEFAPSALVGALSDWVDADDEGFRESASYREREPPYDAANRIAYSWPELLDVEGWRRDLFNQRPRQSSLEAFNADLVDAVTIAPVDRERPLPINVNTASRESLEGVFGVGRDEMVKTILVLRMMKPIRLLDTVFAATDPEAARDIRPYLDVRSRIFRVEARAVAGSRSARIRALASRDSSGRVEILQWVF